MVREIYQTNYQFLHEISLPYCSLNIYSAFSFKIKTKWQKTGVVNLTVQILAELIPHFVLNCSFTIRGL